jgi:L-malate glycosyltransferase
MKLLIISHPCVTPINQELFAEIEHQTGWDTTLVMPSNWRHEYDRSLIEPQRWPTFRGQIHTIPVWKAGSIPLHTYRSLFINLFRQTQPDFIFVHHEPYAMATFQAYAANQLTVQRPIGFFSWQNIYKNYPAPFGALERWVLNQSSCAFPGSQSAAQVLRQKNYQGITSILPASLDLNIYKPHPEAMLKRNFLRKQPQEVLIGYVGRIVEEKGLKTLLQALAQLTHLPWRLVMVGTGDYISEFNRQAQQHQIHDRIEQLGYVPHTESPSYLSTFDLLVLPSETRSNWKEQFGRVIIEAMACGTPVLGSTSGEIPHLINATGGGLTFAEAQVAELTEQLSRLIQDPVLRYQLAQRGQQYVQRHYTSTAVAKRFINTVEQVVAAPMTASLSSRSA